MCKIDSHVQLNRAQLEAYININLLDLFVHVASGDIIFKFLLVDMHIMVQNTSLQKKKLCEIVLINKL